MTQDDITRMAREAKLIPEWMVLNQQDEEALIYFARLVYEATFRDANIAASKTILDAAVLEEREACARIVESVDNYANPMTANDCAAAIRARGQL